MKKIDFNALLRAIIFGFFAIAIVYMGHTGSLALVLHPKMFKFTYFAAVIFLLISISMLLKVKTANSKKVDLRILVFVLPILFMFSNIQPLKGEALKNMSYDVLNNSNRIAKANLNYDKTKKENLKEEVAKTQNSLSSNFEKQDLESLENAVTATQQSDQQENAPLENSNQKESERIDADSKDISSQSEENSQGGEIKDEIGQSQGYSVPQDHNVVNNSSIVIDTNISSGDEPLYLPSVSETKGKNYDIEKFLDDMLEAYSFIGDGSNKFDHQDFEIVGFVYRDDYFDSNRFMVGRILLTCCISDAQQIGVLVEGSEDYTERFKDDSWVKVRGKLFWQELHNPNTKEDIKVLTLEPTKIEQIEDIAYPYVYFE